MACCQAKCWSELQDALGDDFLIATIHQREAGGGGGGFMLGLTHRRPRRHIAVLVAGVEGNIF